jgi:hypothetical protein
MALASKKRIVAITPKQREDYLPCRGESIATRDARLRVAAHLRKNRGPWRPAQIARAFGGNYYDMSRLVGSACLALWAEDLVRKIAGATPKDTCYQWVG